MIKALFFDLDGTLLDSNKQIPASAVQALQTCREKGIYVFLASARSPRLAETLDPDDEWMHAAGYAQTKCLMEDLLQQSGSGNWTILRPTVVYCPGRMPLVTWSNNEVALRAYSGRKIVLPGEATFHDHPDHVSRRILPNFFQQPDIIPDVAHICFFTVRFHLPGEDLS